MAIWSQFTFSRGEPAPGESSSTAGAVNEGLVLGLLRPGRFDAVLPVETCWLQDAAANRILRAVQGAASASVLQPCALCSVDPAPQCFAN